MNGDCRCRRCRLDLTKALIQSGQTKPLFTATVKAIATAAAAYATKTPNLAASAFFVWLCKGKRVEDNALLTVIAKCIADNHMVMDALLLLALNDVHFCEEANINRTLGQLLTEVSNVLFYREAYPRNCILCIRNVDIPDRRQSTLKRTIFRASNVTHYRDLFISRFNGVSLKKTLTFHLLLYYASLETFDTLWQTSENKTLRSIIWAFDIQKCVLFTARLGCAHCSAIEGRLYDLAVAITCDLYAKILTQMTRRAHLPNCIELDDIETSHFLEATTIFTFKDAMGTEFHLFNFYSTAIRFGNGCLINVGVMNTH